VKLGKFGRDGGGRITGASLMFRSDLDRYSNLVLTFLFIAAFEHLSPSAGLRRWTSSSPLSHQL
jgi:hypothetical protein